MRFVVCLVWRGVLGQMFVLSILFGANCPQKQINAPHDAFFLPFVWSLSAFALHLPYKPAALSGTVITDYETNLLSSLGTARLARGGAVFRFVCVRSVLRRRRLRPL